MTRRSLKAPDSQAARRERALDAALAASFPASDAVAWLEPAPERLRAVAPSDSLTPTPTSAVPRGRKERNAP